MSSKEPINGASENGDQLKNPFKDMEGASRPFEATGQGNKQPISDPGNNSAGQYEKREEKNDKTNQSAGQ